MHRAIKAAAAAVTGRTLRVLYGGSVSLGNCAELILTEGIDGLFVGRAAWSPEGYISLARTCVDALQRSKS
jgi:triosephosphate isomerase